MPIISRAKIFHLEYDMGNSNRIIGHCDIIFSYPHNQSDNKMLCRQIYNYITISYIVVKKIALLIDKTQFS